MNYFIRSQRINLAEETRVNATSDDAEKWRQQNESDNREFQHRAVMPHSLTTFN